MLSTIAATSITIAMFTTIPTAAIAVTVPLVSSSAEAPVPFSVQQSHTARQARS
jgi:hypothetical protein